ncbi:MAG: fibronectin type III domain-containing protein [Steroidobacteraceae bacterium]
MTRGVGSPRIALVAQVTLATLICAGLVACGGGSGSSPSATAAASANPLTGSVTSPAGSTASSTNKSITLSWSPPTHNSDGSSITNLAGYTLHYGTASQDYTGSIEITSPTQTTYNLSDNSFPPGTYYFAISAYNAQQVSSSLSSEVSVTVD